MKKVAFLTLLFFTLACISCSRKYVVPDMGYIEPMPVKQELIAKMAKPIQVPAPAKVYTRVLTPKECYERAYNELKAQLEGMQPLDFKRAVFVTENAYFKNQLDYEKFCSVIDHMVSMCKLIATAQPLDYHYGDSEQVAMNAAIYQYLMDTILLTRNVPISYPLQYDFSDAEGEDHWSNMFVCKLIVTKSGNCHSLPFLYKIIANEWGAKTYLSFAPNHIYLKTYCKGSGWYNTELTSGQFPHDAWIKASGYITRTAIVSGIYMDTLSQQQSVAICLNDLAKGYETKFGVLDDGFISKCLETALNYYPNNINALLMKAQVLKRRLDQKQVRLHTTDVKKILAIPANRKIYNEMEATYLKIYDLGYREMPDEMYEQWVNALKTKEAYEAGTVKNIIFNKSNR